MKKLLITLLTLVLTLGLALPMAVPVMAATGTVTVTSDTSVQIVGVYNKAGGVSNFVDLSASPLNATRAQEPKLYPTGYVTEPPEVTGSVWDTGTSNYFAAAADWIWETERAEWAANYTGPLAALYDADASRYGRVVVFQKVFNVPGIPQSGMLHITADNCVEVWINGVYLNRSATAKIAGWELTNLWEASVATSGWQTVNHWAIPAANLVVGANTIKILAANEYYFSDDGNNPSPAYVASPYRQQNPGALIFKMDVEYLIPEPAIHVEKSGTPNPTTENSTINYTYTVTNTGNVPLSSISVSDNLVASVTYQSGDTNTNSILETTETWIYTGSYQVPWFTEGPVVNTATAEGYWETTKVTDTDDESVAILHNPDIEVDKIGPDDTIGYFEQLDANYIYEVTNTGDCSLTVVLTDDQIAVLTGPTGDDGNGYLDPGETWYYTSNQLIECTGFEEKLFTNVATAEGTDATGALVSDEDDWTVTIFQWSSRTIGFWGNWANHYTPQEIMALLNVARSNSGNIAELTLNWTGTFIRDYLLGQPPRGMTSLQKAMFLMEKQYLAAWFNVKSYMDWDGSEPIEFFTGTANTAMNPDAFVYLFTDAEKTLFGNPAGDKIKVIDLLDYINTNKGTPWNGTQLSTAQKILDEMNNAENNHYLRFIAP